MYYIFSYLLEYAQKIFEYAQGQRLQDRELGGWGARAEKADFLLHSLIHLEFQNMWNVLYLSQSWHFVATGL